MFQIPDILHSSNSLLTENDLALDTADPNTFIVHVWKMSGQITKLRVSNDMTVKQLKEVFATYHNISYDVVKLVYRAKHMDDEKRLTDYNLYPDCAIQSTERSKGGGP